MAIEKVYMHNNTSIIQDEVCVRVILTHLQSPPPPPPLSWDLRHWPTDWD